MKSHLLGAGQFIGFIYVTEKSEQTSDCEREFVSCDLCDTGVVLYQLSYEAITVGSRSTLLGPSMRLNFDNN